MPVVRMLQPSEPHIRHIVENLRPRDKAEIFALRWDDNPETLIHDISVVAGPMWRIFTVDGEPASVGGLTPLRPGVVAGGAFGTDKFKFTVKAMMHWGRTWAIPRLIQAGYHRGEVHALASQSDSRKFIEALGGEIEAVLRGYGRGREDFLLYAWRFDDVLQFPKADPDDKKVREQSGQRRHGRHWSAARCH